jgi:hypothetical protein
LIIKIFYLARELRLTPRLCTTAMTARGRLDIDQKAHAELGARQWMKGLLLCQFPDESERSSNIVRGDVVLALDFLERHAPGQAPHHDCDRYAGAPNDGFAEGDGGIENNAVRGGHGVSNDSDLAELVESSQRDSVSSPVDTESQTSDSVKAFGRIGIMVNNAPISARHSKARRMPAEAAIMCIIQRSIRAFCRIGKLPPMSDDVRHGRKSLHPMSNRSAAQVAAAGDRC